MGSEWVTGGVLYGFAYKSDTKEVQQATDALLEQLTFQMNTNAVGPRFIAGDFNQTPGTLAMMQTLQAQGWNDVQGIARVRWGAIPQPTCKNVSRKDFVLLSPELQASLIGVQVVPDVFPDHAMLIGVFRDVLQIAEIRRWPKAGKIQWNADLAEAVRATTVHAPKFDDNPTKVVTEMFQTFEEVVHSSAIRLGQQGLLPSQRGRAKFTKPMEFQPRQVVIRPSRYGEQRPQENANLRYKRWFSQQRRLVNYVRLARAPHQSTNHVAHKCLLWRAILRAPGFAQGFRSWWPFRATLAAGSPTCVPLSPPNAAEARRISDAFALEVSKLEQGMKPLPCIRTPQPIHAIFRDLKGPSAIPVSSLAERNVVVVQEVREDQSVVVDPPHVLAEHLPIQSSAGNVEPIHVDTDQVWLDRPLDVQAGDLLTQERLIGDLNELHQRFETEWFRRWDRHLHTPAERWQPLEEFVDQNMPQSHMPLVTIDENRWRTFVQTRKKTSATGLDSVSRLDLIALPSDLAQTVLQVYSHAEEKGVWPDQWVSGEVHSLQKIADAWRVQHFRPITIFPLCYRVYSSLRSREILKFLHQVSPPSLWGNRPGTSAVAFWWNLQFKLEQSMYDQTPLSGWVLDIVKAYNLIPRDPVWRAAIHLGIPGQVIRAWASFVAQAKRYFSIRQTSSRGLRSCTGFPEGCGLSVVAMFLVNLVMHQWFSKLWPQLSFSSYVDNWEVLDPGTGRLQEGLHTLNMLASLFDLELDADKSFAWSLQADERKTLRQTGHSVKLAAKDLGGHMQYCKRRTNFTVTAACDQLEKFWERLSRSRATTVAKLHAVRAAAWPRALHSIAITTLSQVRYDQLRTAVVRACNMQRAGSSPLLQLSLLEKPQTDPEFFALWTSVLHFRRYANPQEAGEILAQAVELLPRRRHPGPIGLLLTRLQHIEWSHLQDSCFRDHRGLAIDILKCAPQEIRWRLIEGWQHSIGAKMMIRKYCDGLQDVAAPITNKVLCQCEPDDRGLARTVLDGTHYTTDLPYCEENKCPLCQQEDSIVHRHWQCENTAWSRAQLPQLPADLPECVRERGWAVVPTAVFHFREALVKLPDTSACWQKPWEAPSSTLDLFTDGAAVRPHDPYTRLAGWAVVAMTSSMQFRLLSWGVVPGILHTALRGEIWAMISAVKYAKAVGREARLWIDNALVVQRGQMILSHDFQVNANTTDCDLWMILADLVEEGLPHITLHKVVSHVTGSELPWAEQVLLTGNHWADIHAAEVIKTLPEEFLELHRQAVSSIQQMQAITSALIQHFIRVGQQVRQSTQVRPEAPRQELATDRKETEEPEVVDLRYVVNTLIERRQFPYDVIPLAPLVTWANELQTAPAEPIAMTWYELLVAVQMITGIYGVDKAADGSWKKFSLVGKPFDFKTAGRSFGNFMRGAIRMAYPQWLPGSSRPHCPAFKNWTGTVWILCGVSWREKLWRFFQESFDGADARSLGKALGCLQPAVPAECEDSEAPLVGLEKFWRRA